MNTKYMIVSGFLGSGKTTTMIAMARVINKSLQDSGQPGHSAIIANASATVLPRRMVTGS